MATSADKIAKVEYIDPVMEKPWQRAQRFKLYDYYRKSAYPPMVIEPLPDERSRLAGEGMTAEQRALRKQWVNDQTLHHGPREVPQIQPYNIFRRIYRFPADLLIYKPAKAAFGADGAELLRFTVTKAVMLVVSSYLVWYHIKYHQNDWTRDSGLVVYTSKPQVVGQAAEDVPDKDKTDFYDRGFKSRTCLLYKGNDDKCKV